MKRTMRVGSYVVFALSCGLGSVGCQTYQLGQVLPSGYHLQDDLLYAPKGPDFPLANELNAMSDADREFRESQR
jgi:hypothetical protein